MHRLLFIALTALLFASCRDKRVHDHEEWGDVFKQHGVENGCFIIRDHTHESINYYNKERCIRRFSPASTFKIFNSLVALEEGVAQDETFTLPNGNPQPGPKFDYTLAWMARLQAQARRLLDSEMPAVMLGGSGNDTIRAGAGNDFVNSSTGDDLIYGGVVAKRFA